MSTLQPPSPPPKSTEAVSPPPPPPVEPEIPSTSTPTELENAISRIASLEEEDAALKAHMALQDETMHQMTQYIQLQGEVMQRHEMLIYSIMKREKVQGETSCREDELRNKRSNDEDNDPSAAREGEQPIAEIGRAHV